MTDQQMKMIEALSRCTFLPGSYGKKFAASMKETITKSPNSNLSERQQSFLNKLFHAYRNNNGYMRNQHTLYCWCDEAESERRRLRLQGQLL